MKKTNTLLRVAALMAAVAAISFISMGAQGCGTELDKASVGAASIGAGVQTAATVNHDLIAAGAETPAEGAVVATCLLKVAKANDIFVADVQAAQKNGGQLSTAQAIADFKVVVDSVNALQSSGILAIKNPDAQAKFQDVMAQIQAQVTLIQTLLGTQTSRAPGRKPLPGSPLAGLAFAAVALTPEEIEELIALATSAGSSLVGKLLALRGETDPELQAAALASDQAAENQAVQDGATA